MNSGRSRFTSTESPAKAADASRPGDVLLVEGNEIERLLWKEQDADYFPFPGRRHVFRGNFLHGTRPDEIARLRTDG